MNVSSIGIQLVQSGTATSNRSAGGDSGARIETDRVTAAEPPKPPLPAGVGEKVDKTA